MVTTMQDEAVHAIFLCFLEAAQNANLKIAFLSAGLFRVSYHGAAPVERQKRYSKGQFIMNDFSGNWFYATA